MSFKFSRKSEANLKILTPGLQEVARRALSYNVMDFAITCCHRTEEEQNKLYPEFTRVKWPDSKHNTLPAEAMDCVPWIDGKGLSWNHYHCSVLAGLMLAAAWEEGVVIRWGGNWDMDYEPITDQDFQDLVHFEEKLWDLEHS